MLEDLNNVYTYSLSAPRGRILDINGKVIVDNYQERVIVYQKNKNITTNDELNIAKELSYFYKNLQKPTNEEIALFVFAKKSDLKEYLSTEEYNNYLKKIINYNEAKNIAVTNITKNIDKYYNSEDNKTVKIYSLMNKGYYFDKKIIFENITEKEYFSIMKRNIPGISGDYIYKRKYNYPDISRGIIGSVGSIPLDEKEKYLSDGYNINDEVGISYLEKYYDKTLKGTKAKYLVLKDGTLKEITQEKKGTDIKLNIDIDVSSKASTILKENMLNAKGKTNTDYYNTSYLLIGKPDGSIISALGYKINPDNTFTDVSSDIVNLSFVPGSIVKMASNTLSYKENIIKPGKKIKDSCVKIYMNTEKCSYKSLGYVDDISAISKSSNYYQYINALKIMGYSKYKYNMKAVATKDDFDKYRKIYQQYGLGSKTYIDLPSENMGQKGKLYASDLLLNLSIGQYDSYTPVQILQYINTLANNGVRNKLSLLNGNENTYLNNVEITSKNLKRIQKGMNNAVKGGTATGYIKRTSAAGKTGTSETLADTNNDSIYETKTISTSFIGYAPFSDPKYTFVVISPNISSNKDKNNYKVPINRYIIRDLTDFLFEK